MHHRSRFLLPSAGVTAILAAILAACGATSSSPPATAASSPTSSTPTPISTSTPVSTPTPVPTVPGTSPSPKPSLPSQSDTDWGRIWDALPAAFPMFAGARPTETGQGPTSGTFQVEGDVEAVSTFYRGALENAGYSTLSLSGPMEDGSVILESQGEPTACRIRTTIAPLGGTTVVSVLYGAACPFE